MSTYTVTDQDTGAEVELDVYTRDKDPERWKWRAIAIVVVLATGNFAAAAKEPLAVRIDRMIEARAKADGVALSAPARSFPTHSTVAKSTPGC